MAAPSRQKKGERILDGEMKQEAILRKEHHTLSVALCLGEKRGEEKERASWASAGIPGRLFGEEKRTIYS